MLLVALSTCLHQGKCQHNPRRFSLTNVLLMLTMTCGPMKQWPTNWEIPYKSKCKLFELSSMSVEQILKLLIMQPKKIRKEYCHVIFHLKWFHQPQIHTKMKYMHWFSCKDKMEHIFQGWKCCNSIQKDQRSLRPFFTCLANRQHDQGLQWAWCPTEFGKRIEHQNPPGTKASLSHWYDNSVNARWSAGSGCKTERQGAILYICASLCNPFKT